MAQLDNPENGPSFGADSLVIPLGKEKPRLARSKLGSYYERFEDGTNSLFGKGTATAQLKDLKVYHGVYEEGEYIPFTYVFFFGDCGSGFCLLGIPLSLSPLLFFRDSSSCSDAEPFALY